MWSFSNPKFMTETQSNIEPEQATPWRLEGALTIYTVEALRTQIIERLSHPGGLVIDLAGVNACDCAGLQLLCSARKNTTAAGNTFHISNLSPAIQAAAESIGLDPLQITN